MKTLLAKLASINNPLVIGGGSVGAIETTEFIPHEAIKLTFQVVIAVATLIKFFKDRKEKKNAEKNG